jgi:hypothetical protein
VHRLGCLDPGVVGADRFPPAFATPGPRGRPKGSLGTSKLDGKEGEIRKLLEKEVSKASIAKILDVTPSTLHSFIHSRRLEHKKRRQA